MAGIIGAFMAVLDISITNASLPQIQGEIGATGTEGTWITTSYLVAETIMIPLSAWCVRLFGLRRFVLSCALMFTLFSVICGLASSLPQMILGRLGQGFFGGALIPSAMTVIALRLPLRQQVMGMNLFGITVVLAPVFGPVIGGWLTDNAGWYWVFFLNIPVGILLGALILIGFDPERPRFDELIRGDWLGIAGLSLCLGSLTVVLEEGQREQWFESRLIVDLAIACLVGLVLFAISQVRRDDPVLKLRLLRSRSFSGAMLISLLMGGSYFAVLYVLPVYLGVIAGYNAGQVGMVMMYAGLGSMIAIVFYPWISEHFLPRTIIFSGLVMTAGSLVINIPLTAQWGGEQFFWAQMIRGFATSLLFFPLSAMALIGIPEQDVPDASGFFNMARNLGGSIGLALTAVLIDNRFAYHMQMVTQGLTANSALGNERIAALAAGLSPYGVDGGDGRLGALALIAADIQREALVMAYSDCFWILAVSAVLIMPVLLVLPKTAGDVSTMVH